MTIQQLLAAEHSKRQTVKIAKYIGYDRKKFAALMKCFFSEDTELSRRAAWVMSDCAENFPHLVDPYIERMIKILNRNVHDAVKRNVLRILQHVEIPAKLHGIAAAAGFDLLQSGSEPVAIKAFSMTILDNICKTEPELKRELRIVIEAQLPYGSAGFKARARRILANL